MAIAERKCWHDGKVFRAAANVRYCSNACRQKAYRSRQAAKGARAKAQKETTR